MILLASQYRIESVVFATQQNLKYSKYITQPAELAQYPSASTLIILGKFLEIPGVQDIMAAAQSASLTILINPVSLPAHLLLKQDGPRQSSIGKYK